MPVVCYKHTIPPLLSAMMPATVVLTCTCNLQHLLVYLHTCNARTLHAFYMCIQFLCMLHVVSHMCNRKACMHAVTFSLHFTFFHMEVTCKFHFYCSTDFLSFAIKFIQQFFLNNKLTTSVQIILFKDRVNKTSENEQTK